MNKRFSETITKPNKRNKRKNVTKNVIELIPNDIWKCIIVLCDFKTMALFGQTCRDVYKLTRDKSIIDSRLSTNTPLVPVPFHALPPKCSPLETGYLRENDLDYTIIKDIIVQLFYWLKATTTPTRCITMQKDYPCFIFTYKKYGIYGSHNKYEGCGAKGYYPLNLRDISYDLSLFNLQSKEGTGSIHKNFYIGNIITRN